MERIFLEKIPFIEKIDSNEKVIALGNFDGVHLGHQKVIRKAVEIAREKGLASAVMTFYPHPSVVLKPSAKRADYLTPLEMKADLIEKLGVDLLFFVRFDIALSRLSPQDFVDNYLIRLHAKHVVAGYDFTFGRMAGGNMDNIDDYSRSMFSYTVVPKVEMFGEKVSTTHIRALVAGGDVDNASLLLGRPYRTSGTVGHGDGRGRTLGFPTANVESKDVFVMPPNGVYAVRLIVDGEAMDSVCSIGTRPTFYDETDAKTTVEVYVLNYDGDLYDKKVSIDWYKRLRTEEKFQSADALIDQMEKDKADAFDFFDSERAKSK
ncbi:MULTISPECIES: bifunctional riboflavin kinase/FAD synthetase [unclassified Sporolactobacillus]|uniref:bifunctional riboflavin kinase/FAD synthetase n=1 Tax=unclassified Sporolactobacillus TaxID=2628533 RepID=UPI00236772E1|nr:bifunctional riboflavin kinase/FAD synthetase [Sporolactobacillus sp. CQH2019]MDD9147020.1 bifunctional riboflavin kinase/FAD synthetase [Sporolactobacillus sp. CQH2019]